MSATIMLLWLCGIFVYADLTSQLNPTQYENLKELTDSTEFSLENYVYLGKVVYVIDGDSIKSVIKVCGSNYKFDFRLTGIDTPEIRSGNVREFGNQVRDILASMIEGKIVKIAAGQSDLYGRILCTIYAMTTSYQQININQYLISYGMAKPYDGGTKQQFIESDHTYFIENYRTTIWPTFINYPFFNPVCSYPCLSCSYDQNICYECQDGFIVLENQCVESAVDIEAGVIENGVIVECIGGCLKCSDVVSCEECTKGYVLSAGYCVACSTACQTCQPDSPSTCLSCYSNYYLQANNCLQCSEHCLKCSDQNTCLKCNPKYTLVQGSCVKCKKGCRQCDVTGQNCQICFDGYALMTTENGKKQCVQCLSHCTICNSANFTTCDCSQGYFMDENKCVKCPSQCLICSSLDICTRCSSGFKLNQNGRCVQSCSFPCKNCLEAPTQCSSCYGGYYLDGNECKQDLSCNQNSDCQHCPRTYGVLTTLANPDSGICQSCGINHCIKCKYSLDNTQFSCSKCEKGYMLSENQCLPCPSQCKTCISELYCLKCNDGYFMLKQNNKRSIGICQKCSQSAFCLTCSGSSNRCTSCIDGYSLLGTICQNDNTIEGSIKFQIDRRNFLAFINKFIKEILSLLNKAEEQQQQDVQINSIVQGSTIVNFTVTIREDEDAENSYQSLSNLFSSRSQFAGLQVLSSTFTTEDTSHADQQPTNDGDNTTPANQQTKQLSVVLGIVFGSFGLISIIILLVCIYKKVKKQHARIDDCSQINSEADKIEAKTGMVELIDLRTGKISK